MIELDGVRVERGGRTLVDNVDLAAMPGRMTAILGPNGAGKSTIVKALSGEWPVAAGRVLLDGRDLRSVPASELAIWRAVVPQSAHLTFPFTVLEVVMLGVTVPGFGLASDTDIGHGALDDVGLGGFEKRNFFELSGGERQRVNIARAICQLRAARRPSGAAPTLVLDEPTSNLDPAHQALVLDALADLAGEGWAVVAVLHDLNLAAAWADDIVLMTAGRICAKGSPAAVFTADLLSRAYGCSIQPNAVPPNGSVFVLPHRVQGGRTQEA